MVIEIIDYRLSIIDYRLSIIDYRLSNWSPAVFLGTPVLSNENSFDDEIKEPLHSDDEGRVEPVASTPISRRKFLGAAGASIALPSAAFAADALSFSEFKSGYIVKYGARSWTVVPSMFQARAGHPPKVQHEGDAPNSRHTLSLKNACYPGTNLAADFIARFRFEDNKWQVYFEFGMLGESQKIALIDWLSPTPNREISKLETPVKAGRLLLGHGGQLEYAAGDRISVWSDFHATITANDKIAKPLRYRVSGSQRKIDCGLGKAELTIVPDTPWGDGVRKATHIKMAKGSLAEELHLGFVQSAMMVSASAYEPYILVIAAQDHGHNDALVEITAAEGSMNVRSKGAGPNGTRVQLEDMSLTFRAWHLSQRIRLQGSVARRSKGRGLEASRYAATIEGSQGEKLDYTFTNTPLRIISIPVELTGAHVPIVNSGSDDKNKASVDISGPAVKCEIRFRSHVEFPPDSKDCLPTKALLWIGDHDSAIQLPLEGASLRVQRSEDLLDLAFGFANQSLHTTRKGTFLQQRPVITDTAAINSANCAPLLIVNFAPQHVLEQAFAPPIPARPGITPPPNDSNHCYRIGEERQKIEESDLAKTRISGPSRIVFKISSDGRCSSAPIRLTTDYLTEWSQMSMQVNERSLRRDATLDEQLATAGITQMTTRNAAISKVIAQAEGKLSEYDTAIEGIHGFIFSPDKSAVWETTKLAQSLGPPEVFSARIKNIQDVAVRALKARNMNYDFLHTGREKTPTGPPDFTASINDDDRRQLVAMSSLYGMAALRRLQLSQNGGLAIDDPNGMVFLPDRPFRYLQPSADPKKPPQEGVVLAKDFTFSNLTLSRSATLDAAWHGEPPAGVPQHPFFKPAFTIEKYLHRVRDGRDAFVEVTYKGFLFPLGHRAALLKVTKREFHPYKNSDQTRPTAYLIQHRYIVCRKPLKKFPAFNQPFDSRDFPASHVELITLQTPDLQDPTIPDELKTLLTNDEQKSGDACRPNDGQDEVGVFWPRLLDPNAGPVPAKGPEVVFEYNIDGNPKNSFSPLLFVDNAAAHNPAVMAKVVEYYGTKVPLPSLLKNDSNLKSGYLRIVDHGGSPHRYAAEAKEGQATFETASWGLSARGLVRTKTFNKAGEETTQPTGEDRTEEIQQFEMDAYMEGQDQPPFYPVVERAAINVQSVNRLTGRRESLIETGFNPRYVRSGFEPRLNPSEIFLDVYEPATYLDVSGDGTSTGGVAKPNTLLSALSRVTGPLGGKSLAPKPEAVSTRNIISTPAPGVAAPAPGIVAPAAATTTRTLTVGVKEPENSPISSALAGNFSPLEFFPSNAKLLGIIPLNAILKAALISQAPKLVEKAEYLADQAADAISDKFEGISSAITSLRTFLQEIRDKLTAELAKSEFGATRPEELYPKLWDALLVVDLSLAEVAADLKTIAQKRNFAKLKDSLSDLNSDVKFLLAEIRSVARDPMPANIRQAITETKSYWQTIRSLESVQKNIVHAFIQQFTDLALKAICEEIVKTDVFEHFFGPLLLEGTSPVPVKFPAPRPISKPVEVSDGDKVKACERLLRNPRESIARMQQALFYEAYSEATVLILQQLQSMKTLVAKSLAWSVRTLTDQVVVVLRRRIEHAESSKITDAARDIVQLIENELRGIENDVLNESDIEVSVQNRIVRARGAIEARLIVLQQGLSAELTLLVAKSNDQLEKAKDKLEQQLNDEYNELIAEYYVLEKQRIALDALVADFKKTIKTIPDEIPAIVRGVIRDAWQEAQRELSEFARTKASGYSQLIAKLGEATLKQLLNSAEAVVVAEVAGQLNEWCKAAASSGDSLRKIAVALSVGLTDDLSKTLNSLENLDTSLRRLLFDIQKIALDPGPFEQLRQQLAEALSAVGSGTQNLILLIEDFARFKADIEQKKFATIDCRKPKEFLAPIGGAIESRRRIVEAIGANISQAAKLLELSIQTLKQAPNDANIKQVLRSIRDEGTKTLLDLLSTLDFSSTFRKWVAEFNSLKAYIDELLPLDPAQAAQIKEIFAIDEVKNKAEAVRDHFDRVNGIVSAIDLIAPDASDQLARAQNEARLLAEEVLSFTTVFDRRFAGKLFQVVFAGSELHNKLKGGVKTAAESITDVLIALYNPVLEVVQKLNAALGGGTTAPTMPALSTIVANSTIKELKKLEEQLSAELVEFVAIRNDLSLGALTGASIKSTRDLIKRWSDQRPAIVSVIHLVEQIVEAVASGNLKSLIDVRDIERQLLETLKSLVPSEISLSYDFDAELPNFPASNPIFLVDRDRSSSPDYTKLKNDLVIESKIQLDLLTSKRSASVKGLMRPFKVHLLGSSLDLVTLKFRGATFTSSTGGETDFDAQLAGFELGPLLQFLAALSSLKTSGGNKSEKKQGFYYQYSLVPPEIEVGYRYNNPYLLLGSLIFQNIGFEASAFLPIDYRHAEFRVSAGSANYPILVSQPTPIPLGGGGFFALRSSGRGIVSLEISLEFGAIAAIEIGPLFASGRITVGIYIQSFGDGRRRLEGFMHAVGEGHIGCFGISFLIEVRTIQTEEGAMEGSATYTFTFEVGIFEIGYSVTAQSKTQGSEKKSSDSGGQNVAALNENKNSKKINKPEERPIYVKTPKKMRDWKSYAKHFDI